MIIAFRSVDHVCPVGLTTFIINTKPGELINLLCPRISLDALHSGVVGQSNECVCCTERVPAADQRRGVSADHFMWQAVRNLGCDRRTDETTGLPNC